jgi:hypothetical protein
MSIVTEVTEVGAGGDMSVNRVLVNIGREKIGQTGVRTRDSFVTATQPRQ